MNDEFLDRMYTEGVMEDEKEMEKENNIEPEQKEEQEEILSEEQLKEQADEMLRKASFVVIRGEEEANNKRKELGRKGVNLSKEYKTKKEQIERSGDFTDKAKGEKLNDLYADYSSRMRDIIREQQAADTTFYNTRKEKAQELLDEAYTKAKREDFSEKDMSYILYVSEHGNKNSIGELLKEFNFNPFVIKLLNMRTEKLKRGERLNIVHPLEYVVGERQNRILNGLSVTIGDSKAELTHNLDSLIPSKNVPARDHWSEYKQPKPRWGSTK